MNKNGNGKEPDVCRAEGLVRFISVSPEFYANSLLDIFLRHVYDARVICYSNGSSRRYRMPTPFDQMRLKKFLSLSADLSAEKLY